MKYLSACSGIEAASVAWRPLGWHAVGFSEINPFCCALLKHYYPEVPNHGDFRNIRADDVGPVDVLVAGTPCQSFSIAGLRAGLGDDRGNLSLAFLKLAQRIRPRWVVWENVPGVLSSLSHDAPDPCEPPPPMDLEFDGQEVETGDEYDSEELHAFNCFVAGLSELGYGWAFRVFDAQHFGVPQRRRRVFVVGCLGDWRGAAAVLFESASMQGDIAARQAAGQDIADSIGGGSGERGWCDDLDRSGAFLAGTLKSNSGGGGFGSDPSETFIAHALNAKGGSGRIDGESETFVPVLAPTLRGEGFDASEDGSTRGTPLIAFDTTQITSKTNRSQPEAGDPCHPLTAAGDPPAIAFSCKDYGADADDISPTLRAMEYDKSHANAGGQVAIAFTERTRKEGRTFESQEELAYALTNPGSGGRTHSRQIAVPTSGAMAVRRLLPTECEALMGLPRNYTLIPYRGKAAADGPRYRSLGNSMAVPVVRFIGERIELVESILKDQNNEQNGD